MKVLVIIKDKDKKILEEGSAVRARMVEYGQKMEELHVVVFTPKLQAINYKLSDNVWVHPTNSSSRWLYVFDAVRLGKKIIIENDFVRGDSVITCQDPFECGYVGWKLSEKFRIPLHLQVHTDFLSPYFKTSFFQRFRVLWGRFLLPKASGIRVVSKRISDSIQSLGLSLKNKPVILPIRVDIEAIEKSQKIDLQNMFPQFKFIILMASRLSEEKRIFDGICAFKQVYDKFPFACLLIAGDGPERKRLEILVESLGISKNVVFLGFRNDIPNLLKSANVFLSTSEYEGYGMSLIEAGISGCPVVSTDVGIAGDILKDGLNSFVCPVGDKDCFYEKIMKLMADNATREIFTGRLNSDIRSIIPERDEYTMQWVNNLKDLVDVQ